MTSIATFNSYLDFLYVLEVHMEEHMERNCPQKEKEEAFLKELVATVVRSSI